jgi:hypothetical protein
MDHVTEANVLELGDTLAERVIRIYRSAQDGAISQFELEEAYRIAVRWKEHYG